MSERPSAASSASATVLAGALALGALTLSVTGLGCAVSVSGPASPAGPAERIRYFRERLAEHPNLDPAYVGLGTAHLDRARETHDPVDLNEARQAAERALAIQPSLEAYRLRAATESFAHRFEEALAWAEKAAAAAPGDAGVLSLRVEAFLGLGRDEDAARLVAVPEDPPRHVHRAAARGQWLLAEGRFPEAAEAFVVAARLAERADVPALSGWAEAQAAGAWLDAGEPRRARPHLERAVELAPGSPLLGLHTAELALAEGRSAEALATYERLLRRRDDPEVHRRAFLLARQLGRDEVARQHFEAAEALDRRALDAGEIYSLESLARLYCEAGVHPAEARRLAEESFRYKRDRSARETLACVRAMVPIEGRPAAGPGG